MSKNRYVNTEFWRDEYIENLDPLERYLFLYCMTNPMTNIAGIYKISLKRMSFETGLDKDMLIKLFKRFEIDKKIMYTQGYIVLRHTIKHQKLNENIKKGITDIINNVPYEIAEWVCGKALKRNNGSLYIAFESLLKPLNYINLNFNSNTNNNDNSNEKNTKIISIEVIREVSIAYPTRCPIKNSSTKRSVFKKEKLKHIISEKGKNECIEIIKLYIADCKKTNTYIKNFQTFVNNFPSLTDFKDLTEKEKKSVCPECGKNLIGTWCNECGKEFNR